MPGLAFGRQGAGRNHAQVGCVHAQWRLHVLSPRHHHGSMLRASEARLDAPHGIARSQIGAVGAWEGLETPHLLSVASLPNCLDILMCRRSFDRYSHFQLRAGKQQCSTFRFRCVVNCGEDLYSSITKTQQRPAVVSGQQSSVRHAARIEDLLWFCEQSTYLCTNDH